MHTYVQGDGECDRCSQPAVVIISGARLCLGHFAMDHTMSADEAIVFLRGQGITVVLSAPKPQPVVGQTRQDWPPPGKMSTDENPYFVR